MYMAFCLDFNTTEGSFTFKKRSYCRGYLLRDMRSGIKGCIGDISRYRFIVGNAKRQDIKLGTINRIVRHLCPYLKAPVLKINEKTPMQMEQIRGSWPGPYVAFDIDPKFLQYGWAINGLLMGYLRQHVWKLQTIAHGLDIVDLRVRLEHWWANDWATDPIITWYYGERPDSQLSAMASVFAPRERRDLPTISLMHGRLSAEHPVVIFGNKMGKLNLWRKTYTE